MSPLDDYVNFIQKHLPEIPREKLLPLLEANQNTNWENPITAEDLNNFAVMQLIEAEATTDDSMRQVYLDLALEALQSSLNLANNHLCIAHLGILHNLIGENNIAFQFELPVFVKTLQSTFIQEKLSPSLVYFPINYKNSQKNKETLAKIISLDNSYLQAIYLLITDYEQSQMWFYSGIGLRLLNFANQLIPDSFNLKLQLGIANLYNGAWEGLWHLHQCRILKPDDGKTIQSLFLGYKILPDVNLMQYWHDYGQNYYQNNSQDLSWHWLNLPFDNDWTYVKFDEDILLTVESHFRSIVSSMLFAQQDWPEIEMEFWRSQIKPDMTVIDVGANVGVYTFTAAKRVGKMGKVFAIEPFTGCVECLKETCRVNNFDWVTVCEGAAGDTEKTVKLSIRSSSELNEIITDESVKGDYQEVNCFTLDSLIDEHNLNCVDWLKIDAEGQEIQVLQGSRGILTQFKPGILYENIAGSQPSNTPVAEFLLSIGYSLYYYQPFLKQLIPIGYLENLSGRLNIIALP